jgi:polyisoprenoid-binding protein YceI
MRKLSQIACGFVVVACGAAACRGGPQPDAAQPGSRPERASEVRTGGAATVGAAVAGSREYRVMTDQSLLQIQAYRGGTLARIGHNHIVASRHLRGWAALTDDPVQTRMVLTIPVTLLTIDEPQLRAAAGADFASDVPDSARDGTRKNLLSEALLDGDRFPGIELRCTAVEARGDDLVATIAVTVKTVTTEHHVPIRLQRDGNQAIATGQLSLTQSALGLTPFSVMLGALAVQDELRVSFTIVAQAAS